MDSITSEKFYWVVVHAVLLFQGKTWVLSSATLKKFKGLHAGFPQQVTGIKAQRLGDKNWKK